MNASIPVALLFVALSPLASTAVRGDELELDRLFWADPELSEASLRVSRTPGSGPSVRAVVSTRAAADRARALLAGTSGLEQFQVDVDPRLGPKRHLQAGESAVSLALSALRSDSGTRPHAGLLDGAAFDASGTLTLPEPVGLDAATLRRVARLVLAQPGISALRFAASSAVPPESSPPNDEAPPTPKPLSRTRLELDPLQPEASNLASEESKPRTRLHVDSPTASTDAPQPEAEPEPESKLESKPELQPEPAVPTAPAIEPTATLPSESPAAAALPGRTELDSIVEDFLAQALELAGAPDTLKARVRSGVVVFGGQVESRELALRLRELTRNFDSVKRVTGGLMVEGTGERVPMDALPD